MDPSPERRRPDRTEQEQGADGTVRLFKNAPAAEGEQNPAAAPVKPTCQQLPAGTEVTVVVLLDVPEECSAKTAVSRTKR